jgi:protein Tex
MSEKHIQQIATELQIGKNQVNSVANLLNTGATVPFIARYRKEQTGSLDEVAIMSIRDRLAALEELDSRRETILKSIKEQGKLTPELEKKINEALTLSALEDIYLPYRPKRRTRATIAKEKGLEPLAQFIFEQKHIAEEKEAEKYIDTEKEVNTIEDALSGARDIIAEWISESAEARAAMRDLFLKKAKVSSKLLKGKDAEAIKYKDYFDWSEPLDKIPSHRLLAIRRGEKEGFLSMDISPEEEDAIRILDRQFLKGSKQVEMAIKDSYKRLLQPSIETEIRVLSKTKADEEAIRVFAENLKQLLLASPLGQKTTLAIDPGFRTGCKVVALDKQGNFKEYATIFPFERNKLQEAEHTILALCDKHKIEAIAIGNGTASRETEQFVKSLKLPKEIITVMVNESGASVYSASDVAREEFPDKDVTVRGAISIGRRLMDPLAELVKIDPKAIGVGQYQHDVDQNKLKTGLDDVVISCVNNVGVEVNTASKQLLTYVSGLGPQLAQNIIEYRKENGAFSKREELKKVPRMGDKAYEQAAGFLRIKGAKNPLDESAVHPERYDLVKTMAKDLGCEVKDLIVKPELRKQINLQKYVSENVGLPTLNDIIQELAKPGRDPREEFEIFSFDDAVHKPEDLKIGMKLKGVITNITAFGAFVDIGVHQDGLVHVSHMSDKFISNPNEVVKVQQKVEVTVVEVDLNRKRIALSMKTNPFDTNAPKQKVKKEEEPQGTMADKLAMLKGKFGK